MARKLVVGDIHGGLKALQQVLERAAVTPDDTLIFLGDYVDGWSDSPDVVSFLIVLSKTHRCIFLRGNHDDLCHKWLMNNEKNALWLFHGGQTTIDCYSSIPEEIRKTHITFFEAMENYHVDEKNRLFVHAGFQNHHGPSREYYATAFYWDRTLWEMAIAMNKTLTPENDHYPRRLRHFDEIFIGHTPVTRIGKTVPVNAATVWNIDTGAAFKGPLTIMDADTKHYWQSDPVWKLYPNEKGRN